MDANDATEKILSAEHRDPNDKKEPKEAPTHADPMQSMHARDWNENNMEIYENALKNKTVNCKWT